MHPLQAVPESVRSRLLGGTMLLALAATAAMNWLNMPLLTAEAPWGIVSLELAADPAAAEAVIESWKAKHAGIRMDDSMETLVQNVPRGVDELAFKLTFFDYGYIVLYCSALSMGCVWLGRGAAGVALGWLVWLGGVCDAVENALMLAALNGDLAAMAGGRTRAFALVKFGIVAVCLAYCGWALLQRRRARALR